MIKAQVMSKIIGLLLLLFASISPGLIAQETQRMPEDAYHRVLDVIFPRFSDDFSDLKHFILDLRITPYYEPEMQINIIERNNGKLEAIIYTLPVGSRSVEAQLDAMNDLTGKETIEEIAKRIKVEKRVIQETPELRELVKRFSGLRLSPQLNTGFSLHYTEYDLWYRAISNEVHFTLAGSDVDTDPNNYPLVRWMNKAQKSLVKRPASIQKTDKPK